MNHRRFVSPSFHKAISGALSGFALHVAPYVVELVHCGKLIYAGGDDVLALVPLREALTTAEDLRWGFQGRGRPEEPLGFLKAPESKGGYTGWRDGQVLCLMGHTASASAGVAVVHHMAPLRSAIEDAHELCRLAKDKYKRDAIAVGVVKRSGAPLRTGGRFEHAGKCLTSAVLRLVQLMQGTDCVGELSTGLPARIFSEVELIGRMPPKAQQAELLRLMQRQFQPRGPRDRRDGNADEYRRFLDEEWWPLTKQWEPSEAYFELARWLLVARFIASPGGVE